MNPLQIIQHPQKRGPDEGPLFRCCAPVIDLSADRHWIVQLANLVWRHKLSGLSANQVGINKQVFITDVPGDYFRIYINPTIMILDYDERDVQEACASYPIGLNLRTRHSHVLIEYLNLNGDKWHLRTEDPKFKPLVALTLAAQIQHEMEHMQGTDVTDNTYRPDSF